MRHIVKLFGFFILILFLQILCLSYAYAFAWSDIEVELKSTVKQTYDDNITSAAEDKKSDSSTDVSLSAGARYEKKTRMISLSANIAHQFFYDYSAFDNTSESLTIDYSEEFSKYKRLKAHNTFSHTYEPIEFEEELGRVSGRYSYYRNRFSLEYEKDVSKQLSFRALYANEIDDPSRSDLGDSYLNRLGFGGEYFCSSVLILLAEYDFSLRKFDPGDHAFTHMFSLGARNFFTPQLYLDAKAGGQYLRSYGKKTYIKPHLFLLLTDELNPTTNLKLSFIQQCYTNPYTEDLFDYWQIQAGIEKQIYERLGGSLSLFYGEGKYRALGISDEVTGARLEFVYDLRENTQGIVTYRYSNKDSNTLAREYTRNRVTMGLRIEF